MRLIWFSLLAICISSVKLTGQCTIYVGSKDSSYTTPGLWGANYLLGVKYDVPQSGAVTALNLFGQGTNANVQMVLYKDSAGLPNELIATSVPGTVQSGNVAYSVTPTFITPGDYWVMAIYDSTAAHTWRKLTSDTAYYTTLTFGSPVPSNASNFIPFCCVDYKYWITLTTDTLKGLVDEQTACKKYRWIDGNIYTASDSTATHLVTGSNGCDSLIQLKLTILNIDSTLTQSGYTLTANDSGESYQWLDCDANFGILSGDTLRSFTATSNGNYAVEITKNGCVDTSACYQISGIGLKEFAWQDKVSVYPNPNDGYFTLELEELFDEVTVTITDLAGRSVYSTVFHATESMKLELNEAPGMYQIKIESATEHFQAVVPLVLL